MHSFTAKRVKISLSKTKISNRWRRRTDKEQGSGEENERRLKWKSMCWSSLFLCEYFNMNDSIKSGIGETVQKQTQRLLLAGSKVPLQK